LTLGDADDSPSSFRIIACGDILPADFYFDIGMGLGSASSDQWVPQLTQIFDELKGENDILLGNLECPISKVSEKTGLRKREFLADPSVAKALKNIGFDILSIANNHINQHGHKAIHETVKHLLESGIRPTGYKPEGTTEQQPVIIECCGRKIGIVSFSQVCDHFEVSPIYYENNLKDAVLADRVLKTKPACDFLVILLHWGDEFISRPSRQQIALAHQLVDNGADLILGCHSHTIQGSESYKGKTIIYSMGNFLLNMPSKQCRSSFVAIVEVAPDGRQTLNQVPVWLNCKGVPEVAKGKKRDGIIERIKSANNHLLEEPLSDISYKVLVENGLAQYRKATKLRFLANVFKMPPSVSLGLIREFVVRRVSDNNSGIT